MNDLAIRLAASKLHSYLFRGERNTGYVGIGVDKIYVYIIGEKSPDLNIPDEWESFPVVWEDGIGDAVAYSG